MGWAARNNPNSSWNKKRTMNFSSSIASPISTQPQEVKVSTPARQDEPMVIEINPRNIFSFLKEFLWRMLRLRTNHSLKPNL